MSKTRAEIEAERGIIRDEGGRIIRSKAWLKERIKFLNERLDDLDNRKKNVKVEIKQREEELKKAE